MRKSAFVRAVGAFVLLAAAVSSVQGVVVYSFLPVTSNSPSDVAIGTTQLALLVSSPSSSTVLFDFRNAGSAQSVIEQVFFEKGSLGSLVSISNSAGVSFLQDLPNAGNLPGGNSLSPQFAEAFSAGAASPAPTNGVNNTPTDSESVGLLFSLAAGKSFGDVLAGLGDGTLRVGVHVTAYASGGSESFINNPISIGIPEPATVVLLLAGTVGMGVLRGRIR